ncbi:Protein of unknown function [Pyronema omphalodes CBS 100304]|uniref:Uncharacterized protein n=1 Tax=Pyronema omphalodes (strain CBS 100304) TaxID=1076935 RepID=U4LL07_PYROM|nr:Protein of unknown function [Pyronema omphalodes CBS 100304]
MFYPPSLPHYLHRSPDCLCLLPPSCSQPLAISLVVDP